MQTELIKELNKVLKGFSQFWNGEELHRSMVIEAISKKQPDLIKALVTNEKVRSVYGTDVDGIFIFDFDKLCSLLKYKEYWANSFTKYRNKVGLTSEGKYIDYSSDVVLDFPFKDCILEGGMTKEENGKSELYYNEIIAKDEIDNLLSPKVFTSIKKYNKESVSDRLLSFISNDNILLKGNNLIALHCLKKRFINSVKLIYIDPPYNTGNDSFRYNDKFNRSTWLTFMKNRLSIAKELLSDDGIIFVQCDDKEHSSLRFLMDDIFGRDNFLNNIVVKTSDPSGLKVVNPSPYSQTEYLLMFCKDRSKYTYTPQFVKSSYDPSYGKFIKNINDDYCQWETCSLAEHFAKCKGFNSVKEAKEKYGRLDFDEGMAQFAIENADAVYQATAISNAAGKKIVEIRDESKKNPGKIYKVERDNDNIYIINGRQIYFYSNKVKNLNGTLTPTMLLTNLWLDIPWNGIANEGGAIFKNGKKPEKLIQRCIESCTKEGDLVLDFHLGSGTTAAVAHKMGRRYIGIEQMDYINEITVPRLQKVIEGEQGGISKDVNWKGGGSFVYAELMELNAYFVHAIQKAQSTEELEKLFSVMKTEAHLNYQVALENVLSAEYEMEGIPRKVAFSELELHEQKQLLIEILDKNQLYVNASEMDDCDLNISESDKAFTRSFYGME
ncbi:site-specific DNA-methyltransferase [Xenorhabdus sp. KK7.4]|uniref:site-specific DNA-methyltransferase n=1 Tax=Xenorhabdus sp. KK7.4 TaxID=1851572 RepID=UPI000C050A42|nr:site-specific DNA-methyltransferase [Xenorhabdus sp. KK7.4]PHM59877.1 type II DNA modification methyltransferase [Xenorhabdus sp. KK7.4]